MDAVEEEIEQLMGRAFADATRLSSPPKIPLLAESGAFAFSVLGNTPSGGDSLSAEASSRPATVTMIEDAATPASALRSDSAARMSAISVSSPSFLRPRRAIPAAAAACRPSTGDSTPVLLTSTTSLWSFGAPMPHPTPASTSPRRPGLLPVADFTTPDPKAPVAAPPGMADRRNEKFFGHYERYAKDANAQMTVLGSPPAESLSREFLTVAGQELRGVTPTGLRRFVSREEGDLLPVADFTTPPNVPAPAPPGAPKKSMTDQRKEMFYYERYAKEVSMDMLKATIDEATTVEEMAPSDDEMPPVGLEAAASGDISASSNHRAGQLANKRPKHRHFGVGQTILKNTANTKTSITTGNFRPFSALGRHAVHPTDRYPSSAMDLSRRY